ncbi:MAG: alpha/beta fold hydrolase [Betaproteobacteria bacterium]|nr:alpha/beta fold hydrolase [Betaproteobacteria bacterium]
MRSAATIALCFALLGAPPEVAGSSDVIRPPEALVLTGIPPIPAELAKKTAPYTDFRASRVTAWHPARRELLIATRQGNSNQIFRLAEPGGKLEPVTDFKDPVNGASYQPRTGDFMLFEKGSGGDEAFQISRLDLESGAVTPISPGGQRASAPSWNNDGTRVVYTTTQLDRHNAGREVKTEVRLVDPERPETERIIATLEGAGWTGFRWSPDDARLVFQESRSVNDSNLWIMEINTGDRRQLNQDRPDEDVRYADARFSNDGMRIFATSDRAGEFRRIVAIDLATGREEPITTQPADVDEFAISRKTQRIAYITNEDGVHALRFFDLEAGREMNRPPLIPGVISNLRWSKNGEELAFTHASSRSAGDIFSWNLKEGRMTRWTNGVAPGANPWEFVEPKVVRWKSFDGLSISGLFYEPPKDKFKGRRPVIINIHGGPESQARPGFIGRNNYFVNELGIALIFPNVRGSAGFGKTFLKLDNGKKREDAVKDIGALLDWIKTQPDLDANRVLVTGGSYGGYMSLAVATLYPERIAGAVSSVGISNFVSFLQNTESYRRDLRRVEYGDERDPDMRKFLEEISPLTRVDKIRKPLFVIQGKNDPRVPYTEAEQIVNSLKKRKAPVWFLMANDEGHGFAKKSNADFSFHAQVRFIEQALLK